MNRESDIYVWFDDVRFPPDINLRGLIFKYQRTKYIPHLPRLHLQLSTEELSVHCRHRPFRAEAGGIDGDN